ncbi:hypothetical protein SSPNP10_22515 [Streptomyces sp. NP10]|nr:hypothetical protein SSPNP10_22515 [Streptomyces sp. NP10]
MGRTPDHYGGGSGADRVWSSFQPRSVRRMSRPCSGLVTEWWRPPASHALRAVDGPSGACDGVPRAECAGAADHYRQRPLDQAAPAEPLRAETPGAVPEGMRILPSVAAWRMVPSREWHRSGAAEILRGCFYAPRLEEAADTTLPEAMTRLQPAPGIGAWTAAAETLQRTPGALAPSLGDFHLPVQIGYARGGADEQVLQLLGSYRGQRHRAALLLLGYRQPAAGCRTAGPTGQPHRLSAARPRRAAFGRSAGQTVPRQLPVSVPRASMNCLKRLRSPVAWRLTKPSLSPTVSARPSGSWSSWSMILVVVSSM